MSGGERVRVRLFLYFNIVATLQVNVETRWSAEQLLTHPFLKKACEPRRIIPLIKAAKEQLDKL